MSSLFSLLVLPLLVSAYPQINQGKSISSAANALFCSVNTNVISALHEQSQATGYCSSFLGIQTKTFSSTTTVTPTSQHTTTTAYVTGTPSVTTLTLTSSTFTDVHVPSTSTVTETATTTLTTSTSTLTCLDSAFTATPTAAAKRDLHARSNSITTSSNAIAKPSCFPTNWVAADISSGCSCLSIPTPSTTLTSTMTLATGTITGTLTGTITPTSTSTVTSTVTSTNTITDISTSTTTITSTAYATATIVAPSSLNYTKYTHNYDADSASSGFTSTYFQSATPDIAGTLQDISFETANWPSGTTYLTLPGNAEFDSLYAGVVMQGFFIAPEAGIYTFSSSSSYVDNWGYVWAGDVAYSEWDDGNVLYAASRTGSGPYLGGSGTVTLEAGDAIPMTFLWANGGGVGRSDFEITTPDGTTYTDSTGFFAPACDAGVFSP